ncbi:uncharacterized protein LOC134837734 [Culicoides brevitarsis]|uniref:uncharacterized protein LOC134837734 n=1 Tax=Culicoides brevitarsis TaxID=469753 RepID=UPI00307CBCE1
MKLGLKDLSIHGNEYIFRRDLHWCERIVWIVAVIASLTFSYLVALVEWNKFRHSSTALFIETDYRQFSFDKPVLTVCPYYDATERINKFLQQKLSLTNKNPKFRYYSDFVRLLMHTNYTNLEKYESFVNQTRIKASDFAAIAIELKNRTTNPAKYRLVLTELGVCFTGSHIDFVMNPAKRTPRENVNEQCSAGKTCKLVFEPHPRDTFQHFIYTLNLCATDCRIKAALEICKCVPFFYMRKPVCDAKGMYCLGKNPNWIDKKCECPEICSFITLKEHSVPKGQMSFFVFDTQLNILVTCPKIRIIRKVIYSFKDFLVSFGGAVALFLGFSFVICLEFVFIWLQNGIGLFKHGWKWLKIKFSEEKRENRVRRIRFVEEYY